MTLPNPICWLEALWRSLKSGRFFAGHQYHEEERLNRCIVTVLSCKRCNAIFIQWERTARSTYEPYPDQKRIQV